MCPHLPDTLLPRVSLETLVHFSPCFWFVGGRVLSTAAGAGAGAGAGTAAAAPRRAKAAPAPRAARVDVPSNPLRVFVGNLPRDVTDEDLSQHFVSCGAISDVVKFRKGSVVLLVACCPSLWLYVARA
jgi:hypothetical protein